MQVLHLFPDTNVFIQCRPLDEIDWSACGEFDEIHLIVCRPVQREIDNQKNRGNDRVGKRARRISALFKEIIAGADGYRLVREAGPQIKLKVEPSWRPGPDLKDELEDGKPDDEIIGCLHAFRAAHPDADARLLTHDSGPMATAKMLSLPYIAVPDGWLVPPESTEDERERNRLQAELTRLRKAEPQFRITCIDGDGKETDSLAFDHVRYEPLSENDVAELMERLRTRFPLATDFGLREPAERDVRSPVSRLTGMKEIYTPASDDEIAAYTNEKYPEWLNQCETRLRNLHRDLQHDAGQPEFCFAAINEGNRPGRDALVTFTAKGHFEIRPPQRDDEDDDDDDENNEGEDREADSPQVAAPRLPSPPVPPRGKWRPSSAGGFASPFSVLGQSGLMQRQLNPFADINSLHRSIGLPYVPPKRDPNAFYYKNGRPMMPAESFSLECDQWRHSLGDERFFGEIFFDPEADEIRGALECAIHAENLSDPVSKTVPVTITITRLSARDRAEALIEALASREG